MQPLHACTTHKIPEMLGTEGVNKFPAWICVHFLSDNPRSTFSESAYSTMIILLVAFASQSRPALA